MEHAVKHAEAARVCVRAVPHFEDDWSIITIGGDENDGSNGNGNGGDSGSPARFRVLGPCPRCTVPDVQQESGKRDAAKTGPMATLGSYRAQKGRGVVFGIYVTPLNPGTVVRVGDIVKGT